MNTYYVYCDDVAHPVARFKSATDEEAEDHLHSMEDLSKNVQHDLFRADGTNANEWPHITSMFICSANVAD